MWGPVLMWTLLVPFLAFSHLFQVESSENVFNVTLWNRFIKFFTWTVNNNWMWSVPECFSVCITCFVLSHHILLVIHAHLYNCSMQPPLKRFLFIYKTFSANDVEVLLLWNLYNRWWVWRTDVDSFGVLLRFPWSWWATSATWKMSVWSARSRVRTWPGSGATVPF